MNPDNNTKVKKWPIPQSVKDVEKFLGFVNIIVIISRITQA